MIGTRFIIRLKRSVTRVISVRGRKRVVQMVERAGFTVERVQRFTKTFLFTDWCDRLDVPNETRKELTDLLLASPDDHKQKFNIITKRDELQSFAGESILLHAVKN